MKVWHVYLPSGLQVNDPRQRRTLILTASLQTDAVEVQLPPGPMEGFLVRNGEWPAPPLCLQCASSAPHWALWGGWRVEGRVPTIPASHSLFTPFHNARWAWWSSPPLGLQTPEQRVKGGGTSLAPPREALYCGVGLEDQAPRMARMLPRQRTGALPPSTGGGWKISSLPAPSSAIPAREMKHVNSCFHTVREGKLLPRWPQSPIPPEHVKVESGHRGS